MGAKVAEREAAKAAGERFYETGKPCRNGHLSVRYTHSGCCKVCVLHNVKKSAAKRPWHPHRIAAREVGMTHYSTGKPCPHGHDLRWVSNGVCVECSPERARRYHTKHPSLGAKWARERRAKDPTTHRAEVKKWADANHGKVQEMAKRWRMANPERSRELVTMAGHRRKARLKASGGTFTMDDIAAILKKQNGHCAACTNNDRLEIDHIMPIALGGSNDPHNLQILCSTCNKSKGAKHPDEWLKSLKRRETPYPRAGLSI